MITSGNNDTSKSTSWKVLETVTSHLKGKLQCPQDSDAQLVSVTYVDCKFFPVVPNSYPTRNAFVGCFDHDVYSENKILTVTGNIKTESKGGGQIDLQWLFIR